MDVKYNSVSRAIPAASRRKLTFDSRLSQQQTRVYDSDDDEDVEYKERTQSKPREKPLINTTEYKFTYDDTDSEVEDIFNSYVDYHNVEFNYMKSYFKPINDMIIVPVSTAGVKLRGFLATSSADQSVRTAPRQTLLIKERILNTSSIDKVQANKVKKTKDDGVCFTPILQLDKMKFQQKNKPSATTGAKVSASPQKVAPNKPKEPNINFKHGKATKHAVNHAMECSLPSKKPRSSFRRLSPYYDNGNAEKAKQIPQLKMKPVCPIQSSEKENRYVVDKPVKNSSENFATESALRFKRQVFGRRAN